MQVTDNGGENPTPMIRQYLEIKNAHKGFVLFYRLGDFYEMFFEDAENISKVLELTLTSRAGVPMCGVPYHAAETYIRRLIKEGFKVALCEQTEATESKGPMNRKVVRLVTPGTLTEDSMLDEGENNYIGSFMASGDKCAMAFGDISTGQLCVGLAKSQTEIINETARYMPSEVLFNAAFLDYESVSAFLKTRVACTAEVLDDDSFAPDRAFIEKRLDAIDLNDCPVLENALAEGALSALLRYVEHTRKTASNCFTSLSESGADEFMEIGLTARRNLELVETFRGREKRGSLLWVLDRAKTAMGRRRVRQMIERPLKNHLAIIKRLDAVEELTLNAPALARLREELSGVFDLERLMSRVIYKTASPRDVYALGAAAAKIPEIKDVLKNFSSPLLRELNARADSLSDFAALIGNAIVPEPPAATKDGGYINNGFNDKLDALRKLADGGRELLDEVEKREREATGIKNLRVGYNRVFGYYIEVSKTGVNSVPTHYHRRQTLANGERYVTEELKKIEEDILSANEKILALEAEIFADVKLFIESGLYKVQQTARAVSDLDALCSFADVAIRENYRRPEITLDGVIDIKGSRHPVVEKTLTGGEFAPNDCYLDAGGSRLMIITGPNMSGKSTYMRQIAIITLMAQSGSFVPAQSARLGVVDKIFTRVGASDDLSMGRSTFMVEMLEVAEILGGATKQSLVILDEIGRGTSTFDGVSLAKAVAEHINGKIGCKTLFATHYHELTELERTNAGIKNLSVSVIKRGGEITFLHKIVQGGTDQSYGIEVAKLAGLPESVISHARKVLKQMELNSKIELSERLREEEASVGQADFSLIAHENALNRIKALDLNAMTPLDALRELAELKKGL
ncbi:MAG: DNA mismatch repair protein MutS [Oscillospiraceae bacterium]|jgi:DNA mismatch repair protein MutS|nr:DNA mismatch repair protein MutS [Oscillospiraceae bacterium]